MGLLDNLGKLGGVFGLAGSIFGSSSAAKAQRAANEANIRINKENRDWMEQMSNTEWQRGVKDMAAAGINPMVSFNQGGASTPQNSAARVEPVDAVGRGIERAGQQLGPALATAAQIANINAQTRLTNANAAVVEGTSGNKIKLAHYEVEKLRKDIEEVISRFQLNDEQRRQIHELLPELVETQQSTQALQGAQAGSARAQSKLQEAQLPQAQAEAELWKKIQDAGAAAGWGTKLMREIFTIFSTLRK